MVRSGLAGRLGRIRQSQKNASDRTAPSLENGNSLTVSAVLPGWQQTGTFLFERESVIAMTEYRKSFSPYLPLLFPREREELERSLVVTEMSQSLVFFDLETTGLSHGAGTVAFMAGMARYDSDAQALRIVQILLADYPGEPEFLSRFAALTGDHSVFVSFNGKAFDSQILFNRFSMNGIRSPFHRAPIHLDLLYPARRIWKGDLGSCRLAALEENILGIHRVDDLPGSEAPDAWFDFVRQGKSDRLLAVGEHNRDDCETLPRLLYALDDAIDKGVSRAALIRALDLRSAGDYRGAQVFLDSLARRGDRVALKILAIDAEHRTDNLARALECATVLGDARRIDRLERKLETRTSGVTGVSS